MQVATVKIFFLLTFKLQKFSKWSLRTFRNAPIVLVVFERNGAILSSVLQMHSDSLLTLYIYIYIYIYIILLQLANTRTDGRTNVPANGIPQEHHTTEIFINKGITKIFYFSKSGPWN